MTEPKLSIAELADAATHPNPLRTAAKLAATLADRLAEMAETLAVYQDSARGLAEVLTALEEGERQARRLRSPTERALTRIEVERVGLRKVLAAIIRELPSRRDWLDPELEARARALIKGEQP